MKGKHMANINSLVLSGNLTSDAELIESETGAKVLRFSLGYSTRSKSRETGEWEDVPNYINCVIFGSYGAAVADRLLKGTHVSIQSELRYSRWEDRDGNVRSSHEAVVDKIDIA